MAEVNPNVVADGADDLDVIRRLQFKHLSREDFADLAAWAALRKLDIKAGHVAGEMRMIDGALQLVPMVTIAGLIARAHATGMYGGSRVVKEHVDEGGNLVWVEAVARRKIDGEWVKFRQRASLETYYPGPGVSTFWEKGKGQPQQLGKCARALAIRDAFSETAGLFSIEEMDQQVTRQGSPRAGAGGADVPAIKEADVPTTAMVLHMRMKDYAIVDEAARNKIIADFRAKWRVPIDDDPANLYADIFREIHKDPGRFGGKRPAAA